MDIVKILRKAESKLAKQASRITSQLSSVRTAIKTFGAKAVNAKAGRPKRRMSAAGRAKIAAAQRKRWAKVRKERTS
jgi:hypothetical protein